jgi:hypothetical protein
VQVLVAEDVPILPVQLLETREKELLREFWESTSGAQWKNYLDSFWLTKKPHNEWAGLQTDTGSIGELIVKKINLPNNGLKGGIHPCLGEMEFMIELNLTLNMISGPVPDSIGGCRSLKQLDLSRNYLR